MFSEYQRFLARACPYDARVLTSSALYLKAQVGSIVPRMTNVKLNVNLTSNTGSGCAITQARGL